MNLLTANVMIRKSIRIFLIEIQLLFYGILFAKFSTNAEILIKIEEYHYSQ